MWGEGGGVNQLIISYSLSRNCSQRFQLSKTKLFLKFIFVKFCTFSIIKFCVVVEVQAGVRGPMVQVLVMAIL